MSKDAPEDDNREPIEPRLDFSAEWFEGLDEPGLSQDFAPPTVQSDETPPRLAAALRVAAHASTVSELEAARAAMDELLITTAPLAARTDRTHPTA